jgi:hypothetical protein
MFKALYNAKRDIEKKVDGLNKSYLQLMQNSLVDNTDEKQEKEVKECLSKKVNQLQEVQKEYQDFIETNRKLKKEIAETNEIAQSVDQLLNNLIDQLEIPEEFKKEFDLDLSSLKIQDNIQPPKSPNSDSDKENSQVAEFLQNDKENLDLDRENSESSDEYFSPQVSIAKPGTLGLYTPASRSHNKDRQDRYFKD